MGKNFDVKETAWGKCPYSQEVIYTNHMKTAEYEFRCISIHEDHDPKRLVVGIRVDKRKLRTNLNPSRYLNAVMMLACDEHCPNLPEYLKYQEDQEKDITTDELRKAAQCVYLACAESVACYISSKLRWAADKIEQLTDDCARVTAERNAAVAECEFLTRNAPLRGVGLEDRSRWKARAEALENAVRKNDDFGGCTVCVNYKYCFGTGKYIVNKEDHCPDDRHWEFDLGRFKG